MNHIFPLQIDDVTLKKRSATLLDGINVTLPETGFTMVMGPNGAGKTSLLRVIHGLERPSTGTIRWALPHTDAEKQQSFVFQAPVLLRRSVAENLAYPLTIGGLARRAALEKSEEAAAKVGLQSAFERPANSLSGGEKQKLAIARALITAPNLMLLDEPTTNLDGRSTREIEAILTTARTQGTRIIMTTHDIGQARRLATHVLFLHRGKLNAYVEANRFFSENCTPEITAYLNGDILE